MSNPVKLGYIPVAKWSFFVWLHAISSMIGAIISVIRITFKSQFCSPLWELIMFLSGITTFNMRYYNGKLNLTHLLSLINVVLVILKLCLQISNHQDLETRRMIDTWLHTSLLVGGTGGLIRHTYLHQIISWEWLSFGLSIIAGPLIANRLELITTTGTLIPKTTAIEKSDPVRKTTCLKQLKKETEYNEVINIEN